MKERNDESALAGSARRFADICSTVSLLPFPRPEGAQGAERRCFFFPKFFLCNDSMERKKLGSSLSFFNAISPRKKHSRKLRIDRIVQLSSSSKGEFARTFDFI